MKFYANYNILKAVCRKYNAIDVLSAVVADTALPTDKRYRGILNVLFLDDSELNYKTETETETAYMKENPSDARLFLPTGRANLHSVPIDFLCGDEYISQNDYNTLKEKQQNIKGLLSLRKTLLEVGVSIKFPRGFKYVRTGDQLEPFYMERYDILPITKSKLFVVNNPLEKYQRSLSFLKGEVNSFDICELEELFKKCKEEGFILNVVSEGVSPGDTRNPFYFRPLEHLYM